MTTHKQLRSRSNVNTKQKDKPASFKFGIPDFLLLLSPWTIALPLDFSGFRPLHLVGFGLLTISLHRRALSRLNSYAHGIFACTLAAISWALVHSISAGDRLVIGPSGVLSELDNYLTPVIWVGAAAYVGLFPQAQREVRISLLMRSMLLFAIANLAMQFAQLAEVPFALTFVRDPERVALLSNLADRPPGFFDQVGECSYFLGIMAALAVTDRRQSLLLRATALIVMALGGVAVGSKITFFVLTCLLLLSWRRIWSSLAGVALAALIVSIWMKVQVEAFILRFQVGDSLLGSVSAGRLGSSGTVSNESLRLLTEHPLGVGFGGIPAGLVTKAYDSEILQSLSILGLLGIVYVLSILILLGCAALRATERTRGIALFAVFLIAAQVLPATSANWSSSFFWLAFTMVGLLVEDSSKPPGTVV